MNRYPLLAFISFLILFFASCENRYRKNVGANPAKSTTSQEASLSKQKVDVAKDAYQVSADEYDEFFTSRYGLLYQKFSDTPFTGQIITAENGPEGKFVVADESWRNGKKDGPSTRWFSNGVKMYERNYTDGKWNGTVTRWWPNGQKMYVRAYSEGVRHGEEATWRSDGTPIKKASSVSNVKETPVAVENSADTNTATAGGGAPTVKVSNMLVASQFSASRMTANNTFFLSKTMKSGRRGGPSCLFFFKFSMTSLVRILSIWSLIFFTSKMTSSL